MALKAVSSLLMAVAFAAEPELAVPQGASLRGAAPAGLGLCASSGDCGWAFQSWSCWCSWGAAATSGTYCEPQSSYNASIGSQQCPQPSCMAKYGFAPTDCCCLGAGSGGSSVFCVNAKSHYPASISQYGPGDCSCQLVQCTEDGCTNPDCPLA